MRHRHILSTQLILAALAKGGSHACNTTNMIGMAMSAYGAKHAYAGMLGSNMLHQAFAFPCGIDNHALIVRNNSIAIGLGPFTSVSISTDPLGVKSKDTALMSLSSL